MDIFSYKFFIIWMLAFLCYYSVGRKYQWQILTGVSIIFYAFSIQKFPTVLVVVWIITHFSARYIAKSMGVTRKICFWLTIVVSIGILITGRVTGLFALLGNSYFVLKAIGYLIDVYRETSEEKNIFKYLLYLIYWPTVFEGPFNRISDFLANFTNSIQYDYENLAHGVQRFIWGSFKKLVIAERLAVVVNNILTDPSGKGGQYVIMAVLAYAIQLYADFSGFMDMMLGVSQTFGIKLPENFKQPYFSKSIPEFWRRWHITLGLWFRDYVMFPFTSCAPVKGVAKKIRKRNKSLGKLLPLLVGTCIVWILTGLWHGFSKNYLVWGLYYACLMCLSQIYNSMKKKPIDSKNPIGLGIINCIAIFKTVILVLIADTIICVQGLGAVKVIWKEILFNFRGGEITAILTDNFVIEDMIIVFIGVVLMLIISLLKEKEYVPQVLLDNTPLLIRWAVYYVLIFSILIYGLYGMQYDTSQFLYMQF